MSVLTKQPKALDIMSAVSPVALNAEQLKELQIIVAQLHTNQRTVFLATVRDHLIAARQADNSITNRELVAAINIGMREALVRWMSR